MDRNGGSQQGYAWPAGRTRLWHRRRDRHGLAAVRAALTRRNLAVVIFTVMVVFVARHVSDSGHPLAWLALGSIPLALWKPAVGIIVGATWLRIAHVGITPTDPLDLSRYAFERVLAGGNPYDGFTYPSGTAYAYGPLGLVTYQLGIAGEIAAATGTSIILALRKAWITLAIFSSIPTMLFVASTGANDHSPTFLLISGLVLLQSHPKLGAGLLACAIAVKPYAAAWALPAVGYGGISVLVTGAAVSAVLWAPVLLVWGVPAFLRSSIAVEGYRDHIDHALYPGWQLANAPLLRWLVIPFSLVGLLLRSWTACLLLGAAGFTAFLGFSGWANTAYLVPLFAVVGLALESVAQDRAQHADDGLRSKDGLRRGRGRQGVISP